MNVRNAHDENRNSFHQWQRIEELIKRLLQARRCELGNGFDAHSVASIRIGATIRIWICHMAYWLLFQPCIVSAATLSAGTNRISAGQAMALYRNAVGQLRLDKPWTLPLMK